MAARIEILRNPVVRAGPAVTDIRAGAGKRESQTPHFRREWMMITIASTVQPEDLSPRLRRRQRVQHRQDRRCPDACTEQNDRVFSRLQHEAAAGRADVECIADPNMFSDVVSSRAIRLDLHADAVALRRWRTRERITAEERPVSGRLKTKDHILARERSVQWLPIGTLERERQDVRRLLIERRDREPTNPGAVGCAAASGMRPALPPPEALWLCSSASNEARHPAEARR